MELIFPCESPSFSPMSFTTPSPGVMRGDFICTILPKEIKETIEIYRDYIESRVNLCKFARGYTQETSKIGK